MTFKGFDLTPLILGAITVIGMLLQRAQSKIASANAAQAAWAKLAGIGLTMAGDLWTSLSAEFQRAIADGKIDEIERAAIRRLVEQKIEVYTSKAELEKIAVALGLPVPGIIAWIAEYLIDRLTKAHDPMTPEVAEAAYPVRVEQPAAAVVASPDVDATVAVNPNAYVG